MPDEDALKREQERAKARMQEVMRHADMIINADPGKPTQSTPRLPDARPQQAPDPAALAERYRQAAPQAPAAEPDLLAFVSFSMPRASLERLARESARAGAVLVFRGPKDGSLKKTLQAFESLARLGAQAMMHPEAFRRMNVDAVPVYALGPAGADCAAAGCKDILRLSGDVSLEYALEIMARTQGPMAQAAERRLQRMRVVS
jgi:type-F conjugative transfer system pilin assembly protein TrbC